MLPYFHSGHEGEQWGKSYQPPVAPRADDKSGQQGEKRVKVQLQDRQKGIWAVGPVDIPARSVVVALPPYYWTKISGAGVEPSIMEVDAPGSEMFNFLDSRHHEKRSLESKFHGKTSIGKVE